MHNSNLRIILFILLISVPTSLVFAIEDNKAQKISTNPGIKQIDAFKISKMYAGDIACYVELIDSKGNRFTDLASFQICEQTNFIGKWVELSRTEEKILSATCGGQQDCTLSDTVNLITKIKEAR